MGEYLFLAIILAGATVLWLALPRFRRHTGLRAAIAIPAAGILTMFALALMFVALTALIWD
jgi:hypothetical protein